MTELAVEASTLDPPRATSLRFPAWASIALAVASTGLFALVVNLVHLGFAQRWADPVGYVVALLEPLALTLPGYFILRVVLGWGKLEEEVESIGGALKNASLTIACYAPVIWFYLLTSPTPTFPIIAFSFGAVSFWLPLIWDLARRAYRARSGPSDRAGSAVTPRAAALITYAWLALMVWAEGRMLIGWLARQLVGRSS